MVVAPARTRPRRIRGWSLRRWLTITVVASIAFALAAIGGGGMAIARLGEDRTNVVDRVDPALRETLRLSNALISEETGVRGFVLGGQEDFLTPYEQGRREEQEAEAAIRVSLGTSYPGIIAQLDAVIRAAGRWRTEYAVPTIAAVRASNTPGTADIDRGKQLFDVVRAGLNVQQDSLDSAQAQARQRLTDSANLLLWTGFALGFALLLGSLALATGVTTGVTRPFTGLTAHVRQVADGDFAHPVEANGPQEVRQLGEDVDSMRRRILAELSASREAHAALDAQARELARSNSELEQFAYVASHDLQEPLRKVASFCQLLATRYRDQLDERGHQYIDFAIDGATRMQALINDLLAFSRVGRIGNGHLLVDGNKLVAAALANLGAAVEQSDAVITADPMPELRGDPALLTAVLQNLIGNALKFRDPDTPPHVELTVQREGDEWLFAVTDNGIGVEPGYADRIFIIFQRLHAKSSYPGTGIGLAMCRKIIEYHNGRIWLDTTRPAGSLGSRFCFTLPVVESPDPAAPEGTDD